MHVCGITDTGIVRSTNQDYFIADVVEEKSLSILVVCDGMGGAKAGNIASKFAAENFVSEIKRRLKPDMSVQYIDEILLSAVNIANDYVYHIAKRQVEFEGMGTTLVGGIVIDHTAHIVNIGDSRAYLVDIQKNILKQITKDHSFVQELIRMGRITEFQARNHPKRNLITRAVGVDKRVDCDMFEENLLDGQKLVLCSDGLVNMVGESEIIQIISQHEDMNEACENLIERANLNGGTDNITAVLFSL